MCFSGDLENTLLTEACRKNMNYYMKMFKKFRTFFVPIDPLKVVFILSFASRS
jgi:hypothetical protein